MLEISNYLLILGAASVASASPGPATLALVGTSMASGRGAALSLAAGITTGSLIWSIAAAMGLSALMLSTAWLVEVLRYAGAAYLLYLGWKPLPNWRWWPPKRSSTRRRTRLTSKTFLPNRKFQRPAHSSGSFWFLAVGFIRDRLTFAIGCCLGSVC